MLIPEICRTLPVDGILYPDVQFDNALNKMR